MPTPALEPHPFTAIFPDMGPEEFAAFKARIAVEGVLVPAWTYRGKLIDGRHRQRACRELGIKLPTKEWDGKGCSLLAFIVSLNLFRRHLTDGQRAMIAEKLATMGHGGDRRSDQDANLRLENLKLPLKAAAAMMNVSERSVQSARVVRDHGAPELIDAVQTGRMAVSAAAEVARLPHEQQRAVIADPPTRRQEVRTSAPRLENDPDKYIRCVKGNKFHARPMDEGIRQSTGAEVRGSPQPLA